MQSSTKNDKDLNLQNNGESDQNDLDDDYSPMEIDSN